MHKVCTLEGCSGIAQGALPNTHCTPRVGSAFKLPSAWVQLDLNVGGICRQMIGFWVYAPVKRTWTFNSALLPPTVIAQNAFQGYNRPSHEPNQPPATD